MTLPEDDLRELYQELILDHNRAPRNFGKLDGAAHAHGDNPLCGDSIDVWVRRGADGGIEAVSFEGQGCAIAKASASLMTEAVAGKSADEAEALFDHVHGLCTGSATPDPMEPVSALAGVRDWPIRVKCATLAWHVLKAALEGGGDVSTE